MLPLLVAEGTVTDATVTALTGIVSQMTDAVTKVAPLAIPVIGAGLVVTIGIKVFKRVSGKIQFCHSVAKCHAFF